MTDAGFGRDIGRDDDALRWALATADVVAGPGDWAATPVPGQRAVTIAPGQGQAAQITMPEGAGAKTVAEVLPLPFTGSMTHQGKLICRELLWYGNGSASDPLTGESRFIAINAGDFAGYPVAPPDWRTLVSTDPATGLVRLPGQRVVMPLHFAVIAQQSNEVQLWDLRCWDLFAPRLMVPASKVHHGKVPAVGAQLLRIEDFASVATNGSGDTTIMFKQPFPNGVLRVSVDRVGFGGLGPTDEILNGTTQALDRANFRVWQSSGAVLPNANLEYSYEAIGW